MSAEHQSNMILGKKDVSKMFSKSEDKLEKILHKEASKFFVKNLFQRDFSAEWSNIVSRHSLSPDIIREFNKVSNIIPNILAQEKINKLFIDNCSSHVNNLHNKMAALETELRLPNLGQQMSDSISKSMASVNNALHLNQHYFSQLSVELQSFNRVDRLFSTIVPQKINSIFQQGIATSQILKSANFASMVARFINNSGLREELLEQIEKASPSGNPDIAGYTNTTENLLNEIEKGIAESGVLAETLDHQSAIENLFSKWGKLSVDVRTFLIGLLLLLLEYGIMSKLFQQLPEAHPKTRVKIVQNITNQVFVENRVSFELRRSFERDHENRWI